MNDGCARCKKTPDQGVGLLCSHAAAGLESGEDIGLFFGPAGDTARPDAWCRDCETLLLCDGFNEDWCTDARFVTFCAACWDLAKARLKGLPSHGV